MLAFFVDRERRGGKAWICESTDRNSDDVLERPEGVVNRCAARRTEVEGHLVARVAYADVLLRLAFDSDARLGKARLCAKNAAGSTLAGEAVADRHANRLFGGDHRQLAATAGRRASGHRDQEKISVVGGPSGAVLGSTPVSDNT